MKSTRSLPVAYAIDMHCVLPSPDVEHSKEKKMLFFLKIDVHDRPLVTSENSCPKLAGVGHQVDMLSIHSPNRGPLRYRIRFERSIYVMNLGIFLVCFHHLIPHEITSSRRNVVLLAQTPGKRDATMF